jgi:protease IV
MKFLSNVLAVIVGLFLFMMLFFFGIAFIAALVGGSGDTVQVKSKSVIDLDLKEITLDYAGKSTYKEFDYFEVNYNGLSNVLQAIDAAKTDKNIQGISILNTDLKLGLAQIKTLRDALADFKKSGKFVYAYADTFSQRDYYLTSVADSLFVNPIGSIEFKGLSAELMFFKELQDKSGIQIEVVRHGKYKSAVEPFLQNQMSEENREQVSALLGSVWKSMVSEISSSRKIPVEKLEQIATTLAARTPEMAQKENLVDVVAHEDVFHDAIRKQLGVEKDKKYNTVSIADYARKIATSSNLSSSDEIAIIYAQGEILQGEGSENYIGEGSMRRAIKAARRSKNVKAVVLRVDSPGGSALTSELIWREIELTRKEKPVVVSMGNFAASGGYYIACNADKIYAEANTITGSIGVFGMLPNLTQLSKRIGIHTEQVKTHTNAASYSPFLPLDESMRGYLQEDVERIYTTFVSRVAAGRKMSIAQVDAVAQGRVWTGSQALDLGLVDKIGGMDQAIAEAAKLAKIKSFKTKDYPEYKKSFRDLLGGVGIPFASTSAILKEELGEENYRLWQKLKRTSQQSGLQTRLAFDLNIR